MNRNIVVITFLALGVTFFASADPIAWIIAHPDGTVTIGGGVEFEMRMLQPGEYVAMLTVEYAHEDPGAPGQTYRFTTTKYLTVTGDDLRLVFADGFETGTANAWSRTIGGQR
jgi:hypothetical protein